MAKQRFLIVMNLLSFLLLVLTFGRYGYAFADNEFLLDNSLYILSGMLCVLTFIFLGIAIYWLLKKKTDLLLNISIIVSNVLSFFIPLLFFYN